MVVQWLRLHAFTAGGMALILLGELKSHMLCSMAKNLPKKKKKEVKIHFFINMDIHVPVPCIEKIILSLQNWNNLSLSFFFPPIFPP